MKYLIRYLPSIENARVLYYGGFLDGNPSWYSSHRYACGFDTYADSMLVVEILAGVMRVPKTRFDIGT